MTLKDCTKAELLEVIRQLCTHALGSGDYYVRLALNDIQRKRDERLFAEEKEMIKISANKRREYVEILRPYEGKRLTEIPMSVLEKADKALKEAEAADRKWEKLVGLEDKPRRRA